ncbi:CsbD family protein [Pseudomonas monteilii]|uniref:CsbD family protein n=1 Tax=Pseudomonas monteilii TaxID=76759 RepID=UPI001F455C85|nr:CsbD family protein [Pseudomonas monteilii]
MKSVILMSPSQELVVAFDGANFSLFDMRLFGDLALPVGVLLLSCNRQRASLSQHPKCHFAIAKEGCANALTAAPIADKVPTPTATSTVCTGSTIQRPFILVTVGACPMNEDQVKGKVKQVSGQIKESTGKLLGNRSLENKGKMQKVIGEFQECTGDIKEEIKKGG